MIRSLRVALALLVIAVASACVAEQTPSPSSSSTLAPTPSPTPQASATPPPTEAASPTATPAPSLSLEPPQTTDPRVVAATVAADVSDESGTLTVTVTSAAAERIDELVLRWPTELNRTLFLAPFTPSEDRIRDGGPPLVQPWTKWVRGPGEQGEPDGTISLGWGPLLPGAELEIPLQVTRRAAGPVAFDLQLLAGNDLLTLADGAPAELRVEVP
ncbi:MAG TPA: hypothetical protein VEW95_07320 [Candidatus Limnocylindrales bacterium]|nr:hypothetical protein [Candidatus Limnocylindrales bacterium]